MHPYLVEQKDKVREENPIRGQIVFTSETAQGLLVSLQRIHIFLSFPVGQTQRG